MQEETTEPERNASSTTLDQSRPRRASQSDKLWTRDFIMITAVNFFLLVNYYMLMVVMTDYALNTYRASPAVAAFCASIFIVGTLLTRFISAPIMAVLGRKRTLILGALCELALSLVYLIQPPLAVLMVVRFAHGLAYGVSTNASATIGTALVPRARKGEGVGYFMLSVTLGAAIGPFAGMLLSSTFGYEAMFVASVALSAVPLLGSLPIKVPEVGKTKAAPERTAQDAGATQPAARPSLLASVVETSVVPIALVCGLLFFGYSSLLTFLTPYAQEIGLSGAASFFFVMYALSTFATRPITGRALDRHGPACVMFPSFVAFVAGMLLMGAAANDAMLLISAALIGFGVSTVQASGLAMAVRSVPDSRLSLANSTYYIFIDTGVGIGPLILGTILPLTGYNLMYFLMGGVGIIATVLFVAIDRRSKARAKKA